MPITLVNPPTTTDHGLPYKHTPIFSMFFHPKSECSIAITFLILTTDFQGLVTVFQTPTASLFCFSSREVEVIGRYFVTPLKYLLIVSSLVSYFYLRFWHK